VHGPHFGLGDATRLVPSYDLTGEAFDPHRYWRGPAWFNTNWMLERGLRLHGERGRADALRTALLETAEASGFAEYVDPYTGEACGALGFGWTAALALDLLHQDDRDHGHDRGRRDEHGQHLDGHERHHGPNDGPNDERHNERHHERHHDNEVVFGMSDQGGDRE
uniref:MGH1-like glycoside hydrolase domain-containing protein n=1 Tax=Streptomyces scabiei TaxID=1930 RepID=UPI004038970C